MNVQKSTLERLRKDQGGTLEDRVKLQQECGVRGLASTGTNMELVEQLAKNSDLSPDRKQKGQGRKKK